MQPTMKLGQLVEYNKRNFFFENYAEKLCKQTSSRPLFYFLKKLYINASGL